MDFTGSVFCWTLVVLGVCGGAFLIEASFRGRRRTSVFAVAGLVVVSLTCGWASARAQDALGADIQAIIAQSKARVEKAAEGLQGFVDRAPARENPYTADAEQLSRDNAAKIRQGLGMVDSKMFGQDVSGHLGPAVSDGAFYVAVSLTMPAQALRDLSRDVSKAGGKLVIRGLVNNSFPQTAAAARRVFDEKSLNGIAIEPQVFRAFKIDQVPVFIAATEPVQPCTEGVTCTSAAPPFDKIAGNISTGEALRQLGSRGTGAPKVARAALRNLEAR